MLIWLSCWSFQWSLTGLLNTIATDYQPINSSSWWSFEAMMETCPWRKPATSQTSIKKWTRPELLSAQNFTFQISPCLPCITIVYHIDTFFASWRLNPKQMSPLLYCHSTCLRLSHKHNFLLMHFQIFCVFTIVTFGQSWTMYQFPCDELCKEYNEHLETRTYST